jgi:predicted NACHT family NTPase
VIVVNYKRRFTTQAQSAAEISKMSAVIRIKRRISEEPQSAFILNCKRQKTDPEHVAAAPDETSTVLKFAGTVNEVSQSENHFSNADSEKISF